MKQLARELRNASTEAERQLWFHLRNRRLGGYKFRRQVVVDGYIVDFLCLEAKLIIEADGGQHCINRFQDEVRSTHLERLGYRVVRFWNHEILFETEAVLSSILDELLRSPHPNPSP
jgi:very-short-patch-repair endonuclease